MTDSIQESDRWLMLAEIANAEGSDPQQYIQQVRIVLLRRMLIQHLCKWIAMKMNWLFLKNALKSLYTRENAGMISEDEISR